MQNLLPIVTIAHRCGNSGANRLKPAAGKITAMKAVLALFKKSYVRKFSFQSQFANAAARTDGELGPAGLDLY